MKGIKVILFDKREVGKNAVNEPIYEEVPIEVDNVLVAPVSAQDMKETYDLTGKKVVYTLAIPKGDANTWENRRVKFFDQEWFTVGFPMEGIENLIPLSWNRKVQVERYE